MAGELGKFQKTPKTEYHPLKVDLVSPVQKFWYPVPKYIGTEVARPPPSCDGLGSSDA